MMGPEICMTSMLNFLYAVCSQEFEIVSEVDLAAFLLRGGEHSEFIANETDEIDLVDSDTFVATFLAAFTMMLILNYYVGDVEEYI